MKMVFNVLKNRIFRCWKAAKEVNSITGENSTKLFIEVVYSWFRYGASDEDFVTLEFYRKNSREKKRWLTSRKNNNIVRRLYNQDVISLFDNKSIFVKRFRQFIHHDYIISAESTENEIVNFIEKYKNVIVKPAGGSCGIGIYKLGADNKTAINELLQSINQGTSYVIEEMIVQHHDMAKLNSASVNTIRVETIVDRAGIPHISNALAMMGTNDSVVNNAHHGGIMCHVDLSTGIIDGYGRNPLGEKCLFNPGSGCLLLGYQLPNWTGVLDYAKHLALVCPEARYIGWDIVILEDGYDVIEGNIHPGVCTQACDGQGRWTFVNSKL